MSLHKCSICGKFVTDEEIAIKKDGEIICKLCSLKMAEKELKEKIKEKEEERKKKEEELIKKREKNKSLKIFLMISIPLIVIEIIGLFTLPYFAKKENTIEKFSTPMQEDIAYEAELYKYNLLVMQYYVETGGLPNTLDEIAQKIKEKLPDFISYKRDPEKGYIISVKKENGEIISISGDKMIYNMPITKKES